MLDDIQAEEPDIDLCSGQILDLRALFTSIVGDLSPTERMEHDGIRTAIGNTLGELVVGGVEGVLSEVEHQWQAQCVDTTLTLPLDEEERVKLVAFSQVSSALAKLSKSAKGF